jgi:tetratricopeptide (TPR) repeat protein
MTTICDHEAARRARSLEAHGFRRAAIDVLEAALATDPDAGPLWPLRAAMLHREGRHDEAFADIQVALTVTPLGPDALLILADGYARAGLETSAADVYEQVATAPARAYEMWAPIFAGLWQLKRWQAALNVCRRAAQERPDDDGVYFAMAQALVRMGRPAEMIISVLSKAIDLSPNDSRYRVLLATQFLRTARQQEAYNCIVDLSPEAFADVTCACCAWKLLRLCVTYGDAPRSAVFAAQLAHLSVASRQARRAGGDEAIAEGGA